MRKLLSVLLCLFIGISLATAQTTKVSGVVVSAEDGEPIIGASVVAKGTNVGTVTDFDGKFNLNVPSSIHHLLVSYVGMKSQEVPVKSSIRVIMESASEELDEVMVVAFGTAKKSSFTGSAATISTENITNRQVANVTNALAGQVAGVQVTKSNGQPGTTSTVRIRGIGSISAGNSPLYVVDGVPFDGDIASINPADIETMTVLKDAASNALYGARGANGVILITTKKGQTGEAKINVDAKWGTNRRGVPNYDVIKDPAIYLEKIYQSIYNDSYYGKESPGNAAVANAYANQWIGTNENGGVGYQIYTVPKGGSLIGMDGKLNPAATLGYSDGTYYYTPDNWYNELFDKGNLRQEYNVSVSGANDKFTYYMSGGYLDDSGIVKNSGFTRYSARSRVDYQAKKWLRVGSNMAYTNYTMSSPANQTSNGSSVNLFYLTNYISPIYPLYVRDAQGQIMKDNRGFTVYDFGDGTSTNFKRTWMSGSNPASVIELDKREYISDVFTGRWNVNVDIWDGLKFTYNLGVDVDNQRYTRLYNAYYGQYSKVGGVVYAGSTRNWSVNNQQLLSYKKLFDDVHDVDVLIGHETYKYEYKYLLGSKEKLYNPEIAEIDNGILNPSASSYTDNYSTEGYFGRVQYEYDAKYIVSGSYRRDGSSRFHKDHRWGNFGSVGGAWVVNKENFMADATWIDFLKYKISYGVQGNDNLLYTDGYVNYYPYQDQFQVTDNAGDFAVIQTYKGNKDITWETSYSFNTGFDFNFFNGYLSGGVEYFSRKTKDLLYYRPVPLSGGFALLPVNVGSIRNNGFEIDLNSQFIKTKNVEVGVNLNATFLKNKILKLAPELKGELKDGTRIYQEGKSMYQLYLRKYAGINENGVALYYQEKEDENGNMYLDTTDQFSQATQFATGNILPHVYGGFGLNAKAYGFDFSIAFAYQLGGKMLDSGYQSLMHGGSAASAGQNWHKDILNSWTETNTNTDIPRVKVGDTYSNSTSDRFLISSNYLDITNITFGYTLPKKLTQKAFIGHARLFFVADNVALFSKRKGLDPRQSYTTAAAYSYSPIRTLSGGINITF